MVETVDLPVAREPVRPMRIMVVCDGGGVAKGAGLLGGTTVPRLAE